MSAAVMEADDAAEPDAPQAVPFTVEITRAAVTAILGEVQRGCNELETGGILLGHDHGDRCFIVVAGGPGPGARRERLAFSRDLQHAEELADRAWNDHRAVWLGEWHTHPSSPPVPSAMDMTSYARHLADPELGFSQFLSIVVGLVGPPAADRPDGGDPPPPSLTASDAQHAALPPPLLVTWVVDDHGASAVPLRIIEESP